jgi:hypothetical protein
LFGNLLISEGPAKRIGFISLSTCDSSESGHVREQVCRNLVVLQRNGKVPAERRIFAPGRVIKKGSIFRRLHRRHKTLQGTTGANKNFYHVSIAPESVLYWFNTLYFHI